MDAANEDLTRNISSEAAGTELLTLDLTAIRHKPEMAIRAAVGKYMRNPAKWITLTGSRGSATLDRDHHRIQFRANDGWSMTVLSEQDAGYCGIADSLTTVKPSSSFLAVKAAREVVRLVEDAHKVAVKLDHYPDGSVARFDAEPWSRPGRAA